MSRMASRLRVEETIQQIIPSGVERKMDIEQIIDSMTPEVYQRLATAVEMIFATKSGREEGSVLE